MAEDAMVTAVLSVWREVTGDDRLDADRPVTGDLATTVEGVTLLNQWLDAGLTVREVFRLGTARRIAAVLAAQGRAAPVPPPSPGTGKGERWHGFWERTYRFSAPVPAGSVDAPGWFDSSTLSSMPAEQMRDWVAGTVDRARSLHPAAVLDVGCGTGLVLDGLAGSCDRYTGIDFSAEAIARLRGKLDGTAAGDRIDLIVGEARDLARLGTPPYDLVLLNSVCQYFPDAAYLREVLTAAAGVLAPGGTIMLGDLRGRALAEVAAYETSGSGRAVPAERIRAAAARLRDADTELCLDPGEIPVPPGHDIRVLVRRGVLHTEMNRFRYDAIIRAGWPRPSGVRERAWHPAFSWTGPLESGQAAVVHDVPDARTHDAAAFAAVAAKAPAGETLGEPRRRPGTVDPEDLRRRANAAGMGVAVGLGAPGFCTVALSPGDEWAAAALLPDVL